MSCAGDGTVIFDTDVLIWAQRGHTGAADLVRATEELHIAVQSYMELLQRVRDRAEQQKVRRFLQDFEFTVLPLSENIGHRACVYVETYALSHGLRAGDALIAATAAENQLPLVSGNRRHFECLQEIDLRVFVP